MWEDASVQTRVATDWYKDVRRMDESLIAMVEELQQCGRGKVNLAILEKLRDLAHKRQDLKPIQKAQERFERGNVGGPAPLFYADAILKAVELVAQSQGRATYDGVVEAVLGLREDSPKPSVQSLEAVGETPAFKLQ